MKSSWSLGGGREGEGGREEGGEALCAGGVRVGGVSPGERRGCWKGRRMFPGRAASGPFFFSFLFFSFLFFSFLF